MLNYVKIGNTIKSVRMQKVMSQQRLAEVTGYSAPHISHVESGRTKVSLECLVSIANALKVSPDRLLCESLNISEGKKDMPLGFEEIIRDCNKAEQEIISGVLCELKKQLKIQGI